MADEAYERLFDPREELRRGNVVVNSKRILMVGDVIEAAAQCPVEPERMKPLFKVSFAAIPGQVENTSYKEFNE